MTARKIDDGLSEALLRIEQRGVGARVPGRHMTLREAEAAIVNLAMVVLWPRQAATRGNSKAAERMFKAAIIDELRGKTKLAQLLRALYGVDESEMVAAWAAYRAYLKASRDGPQISDETAYAVAATQMEQPDAAGRRKPVPVGTVKRNVMHAKAAMKGKSVAWMFGGTPPQRPKKSKAASSAASVNKGKSRSR